MCLSICVFQPSSLLWPADHSALPGNSVPSLEARPSQPQVSGALTSIYCLLGVSLLCREMEQCPSQWSKQWPRS